MSRLEPDQITRLRMNVARRTGNIRGIIEGKYIYLKDKNHFTL